MDLNKKILIFLVVSAAVSLAVVMYAMTSDGWPSPQGHDGFLLASEILFLLLVVLTVVMFFVVLTSGPRRGHRRSYVMPATPEEGAGEEEIRGKMPPAGK